MRLILLFLAFLLIASRQEKNKPDKNPQDNQTLRSGKLLRSAGQDNVDTYRIPGIVTTVKGALIAVYDNRYNRSKDLQEDIDIGMSRSTDGGGTWEPMKVIIDMGEYGVSQIAWQASFLPIYGSQEK